MITRASLTAKADTVEAQQVGTPAATTVVKSGPRSNATVQSTASAYERLTNTPPRFDRAGADAKLAEAESALDAKDTPAARIALFALRLGLPKRPELDVGKLIAMAKANPGMGADAMSAAVDADRAAVFDADPALNRGFTYADLCTIDDRVDALAKRADLLELEDKVRALGTQPAANREDPAQAAYDLARTAIGLANDGERDGLNPALIAQAMRTYRDARTAYINERIAAFDVATQAGNKDGVLAIGYTKMYRLGMGDFVVQAAARGEDPLDEAKSMPVDAKAVKALADFKAMLTSHIGEAAKKWNAMADAVDDLPLTKAFHAVDNDVSLDASVLGMAYTRLGRRADYLPLLMKCAALELDVAERAHSAGMVIPGGRFGCVARNAESALREIASAEAATPEMRAKAAALFERLKKLPY